MLPLLRKATLETNIRPRTHLFLLVVLFMVGFAVGTPRSAERDPWPHGIQRMPDEQVPLTPSSERPSNKTITLSSLLDALDVLQSSYFAIWQGIWPTSIDWTSAVVGTYLSSALLTLSTSFDSLSSAKEAENLVNKYFSQLIGSYFGQDAFSLRQEAYDDMLWVVLGWLESVKFIDIHSSTHYDSPTEGSNEWYGKQYIPAFAHRARIFWELASQGWDTSLCDGGMIWSPYLLPYKNAITNELYITASISMYLYFPGDVNTSPFGFSTPPSTAGALRSDDQDPPGKAHDEKYLAAAIEAYKWLSSSNMTNAKGLYVDGYHISGWQRRRSKNDTDRNTRCDSRNEMVYTYNQGVLLSGQRGLFEATGTRSYLEDGHKLVADVIAATGWDLERDTARHTRFRNTESGLGDWWGLGRRGVLEEACDAPGYCSQDSQTFKGIFFHHLALFCAKLPDHLVVPGGTFLGKDFSDDRAFHDASCSRYGPWIRHNANAAVTTLDGEGKFGMWWGAPAGSSVDDDLDFDPAIELPDRAVDYRNSGVPEHWKTTKRFARQMAEWTGSELDSGGKVRSRDLNDRGRGRTVETQGGGVMVLRALWEIVENR